MELELVNFEQAKALKELGFNYKCQGYYDLVGTLHPYESAMHWNHNANTEHKSCYSAPYLELVAKWLRKEKNIHIELKLPNPAYCPWWHCDLRDIKTREIIAQTISYEKDEEALSAGIDEAIKILTMED